MAGILNNKINILIAVCDSLLPAVCSFQNNIRIDVFIKMKRLIGRIVIQINNTVIKVIRNIVLRIDKMRIHSPDNKIIIPAVFPRR